MGRYLLAAGRSGKTPCFFKTGGAGPRMLPPHLRAPTERKLRRFPREVRLPPSPTPVIENFELPNVSRSSPTGHALAELKWSASRWSPMLRRVVRCWSGSGAGHAFALGKSLVCRFPRLARGRSATTPVQAPR